MHVKVLVCDNCTPRLTLSPAPETCQKMEQSATYYPLSLTTPRIGPASCSLTRYAWYAADPSERRLLL